MVRNRMLLAAALIVALAVPAAYADANCCPAAGSLSYGLTLSGNQFGGGGSPSGFGTGYITIDPVTNQATLQLNTGGIGGNLTGASIFQGTSASGTPLFTFTDANNTFDASGSFERTVTLSPTLVNQLLANPGNYTFSIATGEYPNGAISGTLMPMQTFGGTFSGGSVVGSTGASIGGGSFTAHIVPNTSGTGSTLFYTFTPTGIGTSITSLNLNQGAAGANGSLFASLSGIETLQNGTLSGSATLTQEQARQLMANPGNFYVLANTGAFPNGAVRAQFATTAYEYFIPVAGSVRGATGNRWQTDLQIANLSTATPATVTVQMFRGGQSNTTTGGGMNVAASGAFTVAPRSVSTLDDELVGIFGTNTGLGALRITSDQPIIVGARIYDANQGNGNNDTAQLIDALTMCDALSRGVLIVNAGGNANAASQRTNVGFFNPTGSPVTVTLSLANAQGSAAGTARTITIPAYGQLQMPMMGGSGLFASGALTGGGMISFQASAPIFAYASVVHAGNGDTHLTFAHRDESLPTVGQADVASIVNAMNQAEVQVSTAALNRLTLLAARNYAQRMMNEHSTALTAAQSLFTQIGVTPSTTTTATFLGTTAQQTINTLAQNAAGTAYDRAYLQSQVQMHQMALANLDAVLIPSAQNVQLQAFLQAQRAAVSQHLADAQQLLQAF